MAHNRTTNYSAPYRRNNLLGLHQYIASDAFPSLGTWDRAKGEDFYVVRGTTGRTHPVSLMIVGAISSDKASLLPHGNYNPTYTQLDEMPRKTRLQFYLTSPADDPDFSSDYATSLTRLKAIQEEVAASPSRREFFIERNNLKFNFLLFEEKEAVEPKIPTKPEASESTGEDREVEEEVLSPVQPPYEVTSPYRAAWDFISETHNNMIMDVYGTDELRVDYRMFHKVLVPGTTVVVTFNLKHYTIWERNTSNALSDTFTALVTSVSVLKDVEKKIRSLTSPKRRPLPVSQLPNRGTLKAAADAFSPIRLPTVPATPTPAKASSSKTRAVSLGLPEEEDAPGQSTPTVWTKTPSRSPSLERDTEDPASSLFTQSILARLYPLFLAELKDPSSTLLTPEVIEALRAASASVNTSVALPISGSRDRSPRAPEDSTWVEITSSDGGPKSSDVADVADDGDGKIPAGDVIETGDTRPSTGEDGDTAAFVDKPAEGIVTDVKGKGRASASEKKENKKRRL